MGPGRGGFTLIEVLVALAIVAIGMAAVLGALSSAASTTAYLRDKTFAEWVALNQIATLRLKMHTAPPATGNTTGEVDFAGRSWHWRQEVTATEVKGILRIDVKVRPADVQAGEDNGWFVTVTGIAGDAVAAPKGTPPPIWGSGTIPPGAPGAPPGTPGAPQAPPTPGIPPGTPNRGGTPR